MKLKHKHHIIPRHAGGSDDPSNIAELTTEQHTEAHKKLFFIYGRWQDEVAWKCLSGQITNEEARIMAVKAANTGRKQSEEHIRKRTKNRKTTNSLTKEWRDNISKTMKGKNTAPKSKETKRRMGVAKKGKKQSEETKRKRSEAMKKIRKNKFWSPTKKSIINIG